MNNPNKKRLRRTMMFLNAQKPGLIKDPYIYKPDSIMLDLEDAVAENQKDAARFSLYHALKTINYRGCERVVRINGLDSPYWKEDIRCSVAGGCDSIRIPKTESAQDVKLVEREIAYAEKEFGRPEGSVLIMAAVESARGVMKALDICESSERLFGIALSGGDYTKDFQTHITGTGIEPIFPPGKNAGETINPSVDTAIFPAGGTSTAASSAVRSGFAKCALNTSSISSEV